MMVLYPRRISGMRHYPRFGALYACIVLSHTCISHIAMMPADNYHAQLPSKWFAIHSAPDIADVDPRFECPSKESVPERDDLHKMNSPDCMKKSDILQSTSYRYCFPTRSRQCSTFCGLMIRIAAWKLPTAQ